MRRGREGGQRALGVRFSVAEDQYSGITVSFHVTVVLISHGLGKKATIFHKL